jgi:hypothetical protein
VLSVGTLIQFVTSYFNIMYQLVVTHTVVKYIDGVGNFKFVPWSLLVC